MKKANFGLIGRAMFNSRLALVNLVRSMNKAKAETEGKPPREPEVNVWKPEFTDAELDHVRTLPKKERELEVKALRNKYYRIKIQGNA